MSEWTMIFCMAWCSILFAVGGTKGKYWRRFVLPVGLAAIALLSHANVWMVLGSTLSLIVALSLGYGERTPYWGKFLVFCTYGLSFLWYGWSWWIPLTPILCFTMFCLSNWKYTDEEFFWKFCEFSVGLLLAATFITTIGR